MLIRRRLVVGSFSRLLLFASGSPLFLMAAMAGPAGLAVCFRFRRPGLTCLETLCPCFRASFEDWPAMRGTLVVVVSERGIRAV